MAILNSSIITGSLNVTGNIYAVNSVYEGGVALVDKYLGKTAKAADADKLDGQDSSYFLNTGSDGQTRAGNLTLNGVTTHNGHSNFTSSVTMYQGAFIGTSIPGKDDGTNVYMGRDLRMNRSSGALSGVYINSAQTNKLYGLAYKTGWTCKSNYKGDGSSTVSTNADGMWICNRTNSGTTHSGHLSQMFDNTFTSGATFPVDAMSTKPLIISIISDTQIDATDTEYLVINGWRYSGTTGTTDHFGTLTSYKVEILTNPTNDTWVTVLNRSNVNDVISCIKIPLWSSLGGTDSYTFLYGIRLTVYGAVVGGLNNQFGFTEIKLMECRPAGKPSDSVGALDQMGGTICGDLWLTSKYPDMCIAPQATNTGLLGKSDKQWKELRAQNIYENGSLLGSKYFSPSTTAGTYLATRNSDGTISSTSASTMLKGTYNSSTGVLTITSI